MTVLSRGARVRRGGRRPGWVLLTALLVLAIGASSALVFTDRVELLKLAVILALWAAVAGAFVSVLYRRQAEADQARARDMKLVYDLQLDREISARREYELTVESQLRRELAAEIHAQAADEIAALRAELASLRTNLEILFDTDLEQRPALETLGRDGTRALTDRAPAQNGEIPPADWVTSDRVTAVRRDDRIVRSDDTAIIDVPEEPLLPPRPPAPVREQPAPVPQFAAPAPPETPAEPRHRPPPQAPQQPAWPQPPAAWPQPQTPPPAPLSPEPRPERPAEWQPVAAEGQWLPPGTPGSRWAPSDPAPPGQSGRRRRYRDAEDEPAGAHGEAPSQYGGRRSRSRHSAEYRDHGVGSFARTEDSGPDESVAPAEPASPRLAPAPPASRHRSADADASDVPEEPAGGQTVADLMARLQVQPGGGRRRRRDG